MQHLFMTFILLCSIPHFSFAKTNIIGGKIASDDQFRNVVGLVSKDQNIFCTGTLIHPRVVLTATHCVSSFKHAATFKQEIILIHTGNGKITSDNLHEVKSIHTYLRTDSEFFLRNEKKEPMMNDIAILILKKSIKGIAAAKLILSSIDIINSTPKSPMLIAGFGLNENLQSGIKRYGFPSFYAADVSTNRLMLLFTDQGNLSAPYRGDSGGPIFIQTLTDVKQIGVVSYLKAAKSLDPDPRQVVYTLPHKFLCWMESKTQIDFQHQFDCHDVTQQMPTDLPGLDIHFD